MSAPVTVKGRLTRDPELAFTGEGKPVARFSVVTSRRVKNRVTDEWEDADTSFWDVTAFGPLAENVCESLEKGSSVIVTGNMHQREYEKDGEKRRAWSILADDVAASCRFRKVTISADGTRAAGAGRPADDEPPF